MRAQAEVFELFMLGGATEKRYRAMRPEMETLPWGTLDPRKHPADLVAAARRSWTLAAFQEHRTGAACASTLHALIAARAPLDLIATATRFPLDEMVHVEMCARVAQELGGGVEVVHNPAGLIPQAPPGLSPLMTAADLVVRYYCVGEAISIPLLHGAWRVARHPLIKGVLGHIVRDEAAHGLFGWAFLDWAADEIDADDRAYLGRVARDTIAVLTRNWAEVSKSVRRSNDEIHTLGWIRSEDYLALARRSLQKRVIEPLQARGIDPTTAPDDDASGVIAPVGLSDADFVAA